MENRELQNRFLQPIKDSDRQGDRNPRVFLKAKVIPASSQLNPDRELLKFLSFLANHHQTQNLVQLILRNNLGLERMIY